MKQGRFEEEIRGKFQNQSVTPPPSIWDNIERELDKDLLGVYTSNNKKYRYASIAAAIILLISSIGVGTYFWNQGHPEPYNGKTYNALLNGKNDFRFDKFNTAHNFSNSNLLFSPIYVYVDNKKEKNRSKKVNSNIFTTQEAEIPTLLADNEPNQLTEQTIIASNIEPKSALLADLGTIEPKILDDLEPLYVFDWASYEAEQKRKKENSSTEDKLWTSLTAGVGNYSPTQNETFISNQAAPAAVFNSAENKNADALTVPTSETLKSKMQNGTAQSINLGLGVKLGKKWTLESGLAYTSIKNAGTTSISLANIASIERNDKQLEFASEENPSNARLIPVEPEIQTKEVDVNSITEYAAIPVKVGYSLINTNKINIRLNAGISTGYLVGNRVSDASNQIVHATNTLQKVNVEGIGGIALGYNLSEKLNFTIEPSYRQTLGSDELKSLPSQAMVMTGLSYSLK